MKTVEELEEEIFNKGNGWISVENELPENGIRPIIIKDGNGCYDVGTYNDNKFWFNSDFKVSHWSYID